MYGLCKRNIELAVMTINRIYKNNLSSSLYLKRNNLNMTT